VLLILGQRLGGLDIEEPLPGRGKLVHSKGHTGFEEIDAWLLPWTALSGRSRAQVKSGIQYLANGVSNTLNRFIKSVQSGGQLQLEMDRGLSREGHEDIALFSRGISFWMRRPLSRDGGNHRRGGGDILRNMEPAPW